MVGHLEVKIRRPHVTLTHWTGYPGQAFGDARLVAGYIGGSQDLKLSGLSTWRALSDASWISSDNIRRRPPRRALWATSRG